MKPCLCPRPAKARLRHAILGHIAAPSSSEALTRRDGGRGGSSRFINTITDMFSKGGYRNTCGYVGRCINTPESSRKHWISHVKRSSEGVSLSSLHRPPPPLSLHPSLHVISVCASRQASPLRTSSGPLLGDGPLINEGAKGCVCLCVCACARVSLFLGSYH